MDSSKMNLMLHEFFGMDLADKLYIVEQMLTTANKNKEKQLQNLIRKRAKENQY